MLLHPRDAGNGGLGKQKSDPTRSAHTAYMKGMVEHYQQPQEEPQQMDENVCDDESLVADPNNHAHYQHATMDTSIGDTIYSNNLAGMMQTPSGGQSMAAGSTSFISPTIAKFK